MPQDPRERRKHVRQAVLLPCRVEGGWTHGTMQVIDLSTGGCFIATRETIPAGSEITVHTKLAGTSLRLTGRVVHVRAAGGFALEFTNLTTGARRQLEHFLERVLAPS